MFNLKNKIKKFLCRSKYCVAIFLILFMFVVSSFSVFASSHFVDGSNIHSFTGVPITLDVGFDYTDEYIASDTFSYLYTFVPVFTDSDNDSFLNYDEGRSYLSGDSDYLRGQNLYHYSTNFNTYPGLGFIPLDYSVNNDIVGSVISQNQFQFSNISGLNIVGLNHFSLVASGFSCWTDSSGFSGSELFFDFSLLENFSPNLVLGDLRVGYSDYDDPDQITYLTLSPDSYLSGQNYLSLSPALFGLEDPDTYLYIHEFSLSFDYEGTVQSFLSSSINFDTVYTFNPNLYDEAFNFTPDNPAVPLQSYTDWIATAVGGFFDLQITPGFSLGGIFMTLLAFVCVIWFLKLVAGG